MTQKKIVLSITSTFCLGFLRGQAKYLKENGFEVFLFSPKGDGLKEFGQTEGCVIIEIPYKREISLIEDIRCLFLTIKYLNKIKPNIVNAGTPKSGLICMMASNILGIKNRIFTLRGLRSTAEPEGNKKKIVELMEKLTHNLANYVISITPSMASYAIENNILSENKTIILAKASSNGINTNRFNPKNKNSEKVNQLKNEFGINNNDFIVGFVGRVVKSKGVEEIYKSYKVLKEKYTNLKLLIVGPIEYTSDSVDNNILQEMEADPNVILTGQRKEVEFFYQLMSVFTLPSHNFREGFGNVAMEASASGIPIIVTRGAGCQDAVLDSFTGMLIDPINQFQLKEAIEKYICDAELINNHGSNGVKYANDFFKNEIIWEAQVNFYNKLLKNM